MFLLCVSRVVNDNQDLTAAQKSKPNLILNKAE